LGDAARLRRDTDMQEHRRQSSARPTPRLGAGKPASHAYEVENGVLVLTGYGLRVAVERGHLAVADGVGTERRSILLSRATCGLKRLVVLGHAGTVSLEALRWLHEIGASFVQLGADGEIIAATGPAGTDDARLRRAQALATTNGVGLEIARDLLRDKLTRQAALLERLPGTNDTVRVELAEAPAQLEQAKTPVALRVAEARGASAYWSTWSTVGICFPNREVGRVPVHWHTFGSRTSTIANGPRLAINPINALLNYVYAILEAETRIACLIMGLDPGMGVHHADQRGRDSLTLDLMEPVRPLVDELVLNLLAKRVFSARDLFETRAGNCRLMPSITKPLAEHGPTLARWVAPVVEDAARRLVGTRAASPKQRPVTTPLTQVNRSAGRGTDPSERKTTTRQRLDVEPVCQSCGELLASGATVWCPVCLPVELPKVHRANLEKARAVKDAMRVEGRDPSHGGEAKQKRAATHAEQMRLNTEWEANPKHLMTEADYRTLVLPQLGEMAVRVLMETMGVSKGYAINVRAGKKVPHPRHWDKLRMLSQS